MGDGLIWLLVGALVPLVWYSVVPSFRKPNLFVMLVLGVAGAVLGGSLAELARPEADLYDIVGGAGAAVGALAFTMAHRIVSNALHSPTQPTQPSQQLNAGVQDGTTSRRSRTI